ncbi:CBS domain-containing protein [Azospirillum rugosum]|uniref:CBS domain-containing protein n=1 Tax=Azospirillum rugosum TaxID=416170 RepID=A0ABS4SU96_9PROT|nr:CBS domain-containing protein [Azospirillum rugosum]MBP2295673.1 CBS domain-containing protein [Azospirillum rugosum]MDQ0529437.1 CBS domain-containing protein [Azospirillum rugosum]
MSIRDIMTRDVQIVGPNESIRKAAQLMDQLNVGVLPVCDGEKLVGMITDRDITVRATSAGMAPDQCKVSEVMTTEPRYCYEDDPVNEVSRLMGGQQIRRVPVVDRDKRLVGIVSLGDLATDAKDERTVESALEQISTPSEPDRT